MKDRRISHYCFYLAILTKSTHGGSESDGGIVLSDGFLVILQYLVHVAIVYHFLYDEEVAVWCPLLGAAVLHGSANVTCLGVGTFVISWDVGVFVVCLVCLGIKSGVFRLGIGNSACRLGRGILVFRLGGALGVF